MTTHRVLYEGGAQSVVTVATNGEGEPARPSAATYSIVNLRKSESDADRFVVAAGTAATVDTASTTTNASSGSGMANRRLLSVADSSDFTPGKRYLITHADGNSEIFLLDNKATGALYARDEFRRQYASGATVQGIEVTATFPSAEAALEPEFDANTPYAIDWTWTGVSPTRAREIIWVDRNPEYTYATELDVYLLDPTLKQVTGNRLPMESCLKQASRDFRRRLRTRGKDPDEYPPNDTARDAVAYRAAALCRMELGGEKNEARAEYYEATFQTIMGQLGGEDELTTDREDDTEKFDPSAALSVFGLT